MARRLADLCLARDACRPKPAAARLRSEITEANRTFSRAYLEADTAAIRRMYLVDALALPPNARGVTGDRDISRLFGPSPGRRLHHALYTERLVPTPGGAVELGTWYDEGERSEGGRGAGTGRYILTWVREGGAWRIATDAWAVASP